MYAASLEIDYSLRNQALKVSEKNGMVITQFCKRKIVHSKYYKAAM